MLCLEFFFAVAIKTDKFFAVLLLDHHIDLPPIFIYLCVLKSGEDPN